MRQTSELTKWTRLLHPTGSLTRMRSHGCPIADGRPEVLEGPLSNSVTSNLSGDFIRYLAINRDERVYAAACGLVSK